MAVPIPDEAKRLIEAKNFAYFVTLMPDGTPQVTVVWVEHDGTHILINTAEGRQKPLNLRRDPASPSRSRTRTTSTTTSRSAAASWRSRRTPTEPTSTGWRSSTSATRRGRGRSGARLTVRIEPEHIHVGRG